MRPDREDLLLKNSTDSSSRLGLGCDIGGSSVKIVRLRRLKIIDSVEIPNRRTTGPAELLDNLSRILRDLPASSCGVAVPGFLDERRRRIVRLSSLPSLDGLDLATRLERRLRIPVLLDADTNSGGVAEARLGSARGVDRVLYVSMGTGLGVALIVDGDPVRASHHTIGHVARIPLVDDSNSRRVRRSDEAERRLCARSVVRRYRQGDSTTRIHSAQEVFERAQDGDPTARAALTGVGRDLGTLLSLLVPLWRPRVCVVGGGLAGAARFLLPEASRSLRRRLPRELRVDLDLRASGLGRAAGAVGAALLGRPD